MIKKILLILFCCLFIHCIASAQTDKYVSNIQVQQQGQFITVTYDLAPLASIKGYYKVALSVTLDGKIISPKSVSGDVGAKKVTAGKRQIRWNVFQDVPELVGDLNVVVLAEAFAPKARSSYLLLGGFLTPSSNRIGIDDGDIQTRRFASQPVSLDKSGSISLDMGISATYFFNKTIGVGLQLGRTSYQTTLKADNLNVRYDATDADEHIYTRHLAINNLEEKLQLNYWTITPHIALMQNLNVRLKLHATVGLQLGLANSKTHTYKGTFTSQNKYAANTLGTQSDFILHAIDSGRESDEAGNLYYDLYKDLRVDEESETLQMNSLLAFQLSVGFLYQLGKKIDNEKGWYLGIRPQLRFGLNSFDAQQNAVPDDILLKKHDEYQSLMSASSKSTLSGLGLQIGLFYRL